MPKKFTVQEVRELAKSIGVKETSWEQGYGDDDAEPVLNALNEWIRGKGMKGYLVMVWDTFEVRSGDYFGDSEVYYVYSKLEGETEAFSMNTPFIDKGSFALLVDDLNEIFQAEHSMFTPLQKVKLNLTYPVRKWNAALHTV